MKLYTRKGDDGTTGLRGTVRVSKSDQRVHTYGEVDETNAAIGVVIAECKDQATVEWLHLIQSDLFILGAELATPKDQSPKWKTDDRMIRRLEHWIDDASSKVAPLQTFILPGGCPTAAALHLARTVCRRAERAAVALAGREPVSGAAITYLNRLSDLLFALARLANHQAGVRDIPWVAPDA